MSTSSLPPNTDPLSKISEVSILIVDDTLENLRLLSQMLSTHGYKIRVANSGTRALASVNATPPDLILLDIMMPDINGYDVCRQIKQNPAHKNIPILFISALDAVEDKINAFASGGVDYITKPFQMEEVLARVQTHLRLQHLQLELQEMNEHLEQRVRERTVELLGLNTTLERFVPREFLSALKKTSISDVRLGDQIQQDMTVMFWDIRNFTEMSESLTPAENFNLINDLLGRVSPTIREHRGFIDKYIGDGVLALFTTNPDEAVFAAVDMQKKIAEFNKDIIQRGGTGITVGSALHFGTVMLGIVGEDQRMQGTVISDAVNLASRLQNLTKVFGTPVIVSEKTVAALRSPNRFFLRRLGAVQVRGKHQPVNIFELCDGYLADVRALKKETFKAFHAGIEAYQHGRFDDAVQNFAEVLELNPKDRPADYFFRRSERFSILGAPDGWQGIDEAAQ